jgi:bile acid-coenzyme A ligase
MRIPIARILDDLVAADPAHPLVTCSGTTVTRAELAVRSNRLARAYEQLGVKQGDVVTIALPNGIEFYAATFAIWKLGAIPQPVSYRLPEQERTAIIELADAALVVGATDSAHRGRPHVPVDFEPGPSISGAPVEPVRVSPTWKALASGGSTGRPKLILAGEDGEQDPERAKAFFLQENGVELVTGPLYHNAPFTYSMLGAFIGCHLVVLERFDPVAALKAIETHQVDWVNFVPTMMLRILRVLQEQPGRYDLTSLKTIWHMAAPCPAWLKESWINLVGAEKVKELYASTEATAATIISGEEWLAHPGSVGRPVVGSMRILDTEGNELPAGEVGEIFMRRPEGAPPTYRYIGAEARERDGWESVGDLGWMDEGGYVYISDRRTDMVVSGGANVYPAEVEAALMEHPQVETCAVVGLPDADLGQRVHAVVQATSDIDEGELKAFLASRLVRYKVPRSFHFVDESLRDDAGKIRRSAVRDQEAALGQGAAGTR